MEICDGILSNWHKNQDSDWSILLLVNHYLELKMAVFVELWLCWASLVFFTGAQRHHRLAKSEAP